jgi:uncharacterized protein (DUF885 family)
MKTFNEFSDSFFYAFLDLYPSAGHYLGLHEYDGRINIVTRDEHDEALKYFQTLKEELKSFNKSDLTNEEKLDYDLIEWQLDSLIFGFSEMKDFEYNPLNYLYYFSDFTNYLFREYDSFNNRSRSVLKLVKKMPFVFEQAKLNLNKKINSVLCKYAVSFAEGYINFIEKDLPGEFEKRKVEEPVIAEYNNVKNDAVNSLKEFIEFLKQADDPDDKVFILGKEKFMKMILLGEQIDISFEELNILGESELQRLQKEFNEILKQSGISDFKEIEKDHPAENELLDVTRSTLGELVNFIREKDIVTVPEPLNCKVIEMPKYMDFGFAAMGTAGPFEKSDESFYFINLPGKDWEEKRKQEWLTLFNYSTLKLISIHEAYPGHYIHFLNANRHGSKISKLFHSYSYTEGWAHYTEEMMIDEGYDKGNFKTKLSQISEALIRCCRYNVAIGVHCENLSIKDAKDYFMKNAFMEEATALQEAERAVFDPGYLSYTLGKIKLKDLKEKYFNKNKNSSLKEFHDKIVFHGAPTFRIAEKIILDTP